MIWPADWHLHAPGAWREVRLHCPSCGNVWWVMARDEYGVIVLANEDESACPECEEEAS